MLLGEILQGNKHILPALRRKGNWFPGNVQQSSKSARKSAVNEEKGVIASSNPTQTRLMSRTVFIENMSGYNELGTTS